MAQLPDLISIEVKGEPLFWPLGQAQQRFPICHVRVDNIALYEIGDIVWADDLTGRGNLVNFYGKSGPSPWQGGPIQWMVVGFEREERAIYIIEVGEDLRYPMGTDGTEPRAQLVAGWFTDKLSKRYTVTRRAEPPSPEHAIADVAVEQLEIEDAQRMVVGQHAAFAEPVFEEQCGRWRHGPRLRWVFKRLTEEPEYWMVEFDYQDSEGVAYVSRVVRIDFDERRLVGAGNLAHMEHEGTERKG